MAQAANHHYCRLPKVAPLALVVEAMSENYFALEPLQKMKFVFALARSGVRELGRRSVASGGRLFASGNFRQGCRLNFRQNLGPGIQGLRRNRLSAEHSRDGAAERRGTKKPLCPLRDMS